MADNDFGPKWMVNSEEVGGAFAIIIGVVAAAFVLAPAFFLGLFIGQMIWDVKIFKYPMAAILTVAYFLMLSAVYKTNPVMAGFLVIGTWLLVDYTGARGKLGDMWIVRSTVGTFKWLFSA